MLDSRRTLLRAALQLHHQYASRQRTNSVPDLPIEHWRVIEQAWRQFGLCRNHRLTGAGRQVRERYLRQLERLGTRCRDLVAATEFPSPPPVPSLRELYDELNALTDEFENIQVDRQFKTLSVFTDRILLEEIDLGPFEIRLDWTRLDANPPYEVIALEPCPAGDSSHTTHPHVHDQTLCAGDGKEAIRQALHQGRLCDFFLLIHQVLHTYNPGSAYTKLSDWDGTICSDCGDHCSPDDIHSCDRCDAERCDQCLGCCRDCGDSLCQGCEQPCSGCDEPHCDRCLDPCEGCRESFCSACRTDGLCPDCLEPPQKEDHDETDLQNETLTETPAPPRPGEAPPSETDPDLHSHRLGEAPLPA